MRPCYCDIPQTPKFCTDTTKVATTSKKKQYVVTRIDSHGNEFEVERFDAEDEAVSLMEALEAKGHHQHYFCSVDDGSHKSRRLFRE
jgi:hypothetical protein